MNAAELSSASLRYGSIVALNDISLVIEPGDKVALVGPSGAGKSSLLNVLGGRAVLSSGASRVLDHELAALRGRRLRAVRSRIGMVAQSLDLAPSLRVVHNVNAGLLGQWSTPSSLGSLIRPRNNGQVRAALRQVGLEDRLLARTDELSGGEQQRVAIARILLQGPELVLADEPTASVDPKLADDMLCLLCDGPATLVVSAHDPQLARRHVNRMIGMRDGSVVFDRPAAEVADDDLVEFYDR